MAIRLNYDVPAVVIPPSSSNRKYGQQLVLQRQKYDMDQANAVRDRMFDFEKQAIQNRFQKYRDNELDKQVQARLNKQNAMALDAENRQVARQTAQAEQNRKNQLEDEARRSARSQYEANLNQTDRRIDQALQRPDLSPDTKNKLRGLQAGRMQSQGKEFTEGQGQNYAAQYYNDANAILDTLPPPPTASQQANKNVTYRLATPEDGAPAYVDLENYPGREMIVEDQSTGQSWRINKPPKADLVARYYEENPKQAEVDYKDAESEIKRQELEEGMEFKTAEERDAAIIESMRRRRSVILRASSSPAAGPAAGPSAGPAAGPPAAGTPAPSPLLEPLAEWPSLTPLAREAMAEAMAEAEAGNAAMAEALPSASAAPAVPPNAVPVPAATAANAPVGAATPTAAGAAGAAATPAVPPPMTEAEKIRRDVDAANAVDAAAGLEQPSPRMEQKAETDLMREVGKLLDSNTPEEQQAVRNMFTNAEDAAGMYAGLRERAARGNNEAIRILKFLKQGSDPSQFVDEAMRMAETGEDYARQAANLLERVYKSGTLTTNDYVDGILRGRSISAKDAFTGLGRRTNEMVPVNVRVEVLNKLGIGNASAPIRTDKQLIEYIAGQKSMDYTTAEELYYSTVLKTPGYATELQNQFTSSLKKDAKARARAKEKAKAGAGGK